VRLTYACSIGAVIGDFIIAICSPLINVDRSFFPANLRQFAVSLVSFDLVVGDVRLEAAKPLALSPPGLIDVKGYSSIFIPVFFAR